MHNLSHRYFNKRVWCGKEYYYKIEEITQIILPRLDIRIVVQSLENTDPSVTEKDQTSNTEEVVAENYTEVADNPESELYSMKENVITVKCEVHSEACQILTMLRNKRKGEQNNE